MSTDDDRQDRNIEKLVERVNGTERDIAALGTKLNLVHDMLKEDAERTRVDLRERLDGLRNEIKGDITTLNKSVCDLANTVNTVNKSLQNLYITQKGETTKVNINEKIIWTVVGVISTGGLYLLQEFLRGAGAG